VSSEVDIVNGWEMGGAGCCWIMEVMLSVDFRHESKLRHSASRLKEPVLKPCIFWGEFRIFRNVYSAYSPNSTLSVGGDKKGITVKPRYNDIRYNDIYFEINRDYFVAFDITISSL